MIGLIRQLLLNLPPNVLLARYKSFIRPHLDYGDFLYGKPSNDNFQDKMEKVQYRDSLAITGRIQGTSRQRLYDEIGLHSLVKSHWRNKLVFLYKIVNCLLPDYLYSYLDFPSQESYLLRSSSAFIIRSPPTRTKSFKATFFPYCINEWNKLKVGIRNAKSINIFKKSIVSEKKTTHYFVFMIHLV